MSERSRQEIYALESTTCLGGFRARVDNRLDNLPRIAIARWTQIAAEIWSRDRICTIYDRTIVLARSAPRSGGMSLPWGQDVAGVARMGRRIGLIRRFEVQGRSRGCQGMIWSCRAPCMGFWGWGRILLHHMRHAEQGAALHEVMAELLSGDVMLIHGAWSEVGDDLGPSLPCMMGDVSGRQPAAP